MQYNILYYGVNSSFCSSLNNPISLKNEAMTKIVRHASPDIIAINEIGPQDFHHDLLLDASLNMAFPDRYSRAGFSNINASSLVNELYYDKHKLALKARYGIYSAVRDADVYLMYLNPVKKSGDTTFLLHVVTHLKAGSSASDQQSRAAQSADIMSWLSSQSFRGNIILSGDFNMKNSEEQAWYNFTQYPDQSMKFLDPVNAPGQWSDNWTFRMLHTQSSRSSTSGCGSGGGLDDRFDLILLSPSLMEGTKGLSYLTDSYLTMGQDGQRLNQSVTSPANTIIPDSIAQALEDLSDHLPVMVSLITTDPAGFSQENELEPWIKAITGNTGNIGIQSSRSDSNLNLAIYSMDGQIQWMGSIQSTANEIHWLPVVLQKGAYILTAHGRKMANLKVLIL